MKQFSLLGDCRHVSKNAGVPVSTQLRDLLQSRRSNFLFGFTDYYQFGLYNRALVPGDEIVNYIGWEYENSLCQALNPRHAVLPAWDKLVLHKLVYEYDSVIMPRIVGLYRPQGEVYGSLTSTVMTEPEQLKTFLETNEEWPLYGKPSYSQQGVGGYLLQGYDQEKRQIILAGGESMDVSTYIDEVVLLRRQFYEPLAGYMFQQALPPHPDIQACTGNRSISGLRVVVLNFDEGPQIERALWKIVGGKEGSDNFYRGTTGNLIANVNLADGKAGRALNGFWPYADFISHHPDTGKELSGFQIPDWEKVRKMSLSIAACLPLMKVLHLDIALTNTGPVLLEVNDLGATLFLQLHGQGLLSPLMREALLRYGDCSKHPWIDKLKTMK